jgi:hypothetical protein
MEAKKLSHHRRISPIAQIFVELEMSAAISERDLIAYLDVGDKTIRNWKTAKVSEANSTKFLRLRRLKEVVDTAMSNALSKTMIRQLLVAPLDINDDEQKSIVDIIRNEPETKFFHQIVQLVVDNFKARQNTNGHFVLNNEDFDRFAMDLQSDREPSEAVKRARERFAQLRREDAK